MSYTEKQAEIFEAVHKELAEADHLYAKALKKMQRSASLRTAMNGNPSMQTLMSMLRSPEYKEWLRDWLEVGTILSARNAVRRLPEVLADAIGVGVRRYFRFELGELLKEHGKRRRVIDVAKDLGMDIDEDLLSSDGKDHSKETEDERRISQAQEEEDSGPTGEDEHGEVDGESDLPTI